MKASFDTTKAVDFLNVKSGRTVQEVAEKFEVTPATARKHLGSMLAANQVATAGVRTTGTKGRPATLYVAAQVAQ